MFKKSIILVSLALPLAAHAQQRGPQPVTRTQMEVQIKANFNRMDTNKDGFVTKSESNAAREVAISGRIDAMFNALDADKNGAISKAEFTTANRRSLAQTGGNEVPDREFNAADGNKDGRVSVAELLANPLRQFDSADSNRDGILSPAEQIAAAKRARAQRR